MRRFLTHKKQMRWRFTILRVSKLFGGVTRWWTALALRLATQRARASTLHRGSKETILSESRDVAKMKKDSRCCPHSVLQL